MKNFKIFYEETMPGINDNEIRPIISKVTDDIIQKIIECENNKIIKTRCDFNNIKLSITVDLKFDEKENQSWKIEGVYHDKIPGISIIVDLMLNPYKVEMTMKKVRNNMINEIIDIIQHEIAHHQRMWKNAGMMKAYVNFKKSKSKDLDENGKIKTYLTNPFELDANYTMLKQKYNRLTDNEKIDITLEKLMKTTFFDDLWYNILTKEKNLKWFFNRFWKDGIKIKMK